VHSWVGGGVTWFWDLSGEQKRQTKSLSFFLCLRGATKRGTILGFFCVEATRANRTRLRALDSDLQWTRECAHRRLPLSLRANTHHGEINSCATNSDYSDVTRLIIGSLRVVLFGRCLHTHFRREVTTWRSRSTFAAVRPRLANCSNEFPSPDGFWNSSGKLDLKPQRQRVITMKIKINVRGGPAKAR